MAFRFAVTGVERSGTSWLARVLDEDETVAVHHEPRTIKVMDSRVEALAARGELDTEHHVKARYAYWLRNGQVNGAVAEVNCHLRYYAAAVGRVHGIPIAAIVRDGRLVVRSIYNHGYFQRRELPRVKPGELVLDPFAACCWYWGHGNESLIDQGIRFWRLEDLNNYYEAFASLCLHLGADVTEERWARWAGKRVNDRPWAAEPLDWTPLQRDVFDALAGDVQAHFGYHNGEYPGTSGGKVKGQKESHGIGIQILDAVAAAPGVPKMEEA